MSTFINERGYISAQPSVDTSLAGLRCEQTEQSLAGMPINGVVSYRTSANALSPAQLLTLDFIGIVDTEITYTTGTDTQVAAFVNPIAPTTMEARPAGVCTFNTAAGASVTGVCTVELTATEALVAFSIAQTDVAVATVARFTGHCSLDA
jgi:hypothetical protein